MTRMCVLVRFRGAGTPRSKRHGRPNHQSIIPRVRKPVVLITGAGGEIGHGLIARLAERPASARSSRSTSARSTRPSPPWSRARSPARSSTAACSSACSPSSRSTGSSISPRCSRRASEFTPVTAHQVNVEGHAQPAGVRAARGGVARPAGRLHLPVVDRRLRPAGPRDQGARRQGERRRVRAPDDDVRLQQAVLRAAGHVLRAALQAAVGRAASGRVDFRCVRFPGLISARDGAVRRHVGLRAGDDSRRGAGRAVRLLRPARHAHSVHGDAGRRRRAAGAGAAPREPADAGRPTTSRRSTRRPSEIRDVVLEAFPDARIDWETDRSARASSIRGRPTWTTRPRRADWGFAPRYDFDRAFNEYLLPIIRERYSPAR